MPERTQYPEHIKLAAIQPKSQAIGEFLEWLPTQGITLAERDGESGRLYPAWDNTIALLAQFFEIDQNKLEAEKRQMLEAQRALNAANDAKADQ